jgi:hypothetical protein
MEEKKTYDIARDIYVSLGPFILVVVDEVAVWKMLHPS